MTGQTLAAALIPLFEGVRLSAYKDSGGVWTIGLGHTAGVKENDTCTVLQAQEWFVADCAPLGKLVEHLPAVEAAALISFGYNCGIGRLSDVLSGKIIPATRNGVTGFWSGDRMFGVSDRAGTALPGLVKRRQLEASLILASRLEVVE